MKGILRRNPFRKRGAARTVGDVGHSTLVQYVQGLNVKLQNITRYVYYTHTHTHTHIYIYIYIYIYIHTHIHTHTLYIKEIH